MYNREKIQCGFLLTFWTEIGRTKRSLYKKLWLDLIPNNHLTVRFFVSITFSMKKPFHIILCLHTCSYWLKMLCTNSFPCIYDRLQTDYLKVNQYIYILIRVRSIHYRNCMKVELYITGICLPDWLDIKGKGWNLVILGDCNVIFSPWSQFNTCATNYANSITLMDWIFIPMCISHVLGFFY